MGINTDVALERYINDYYITQKPVELENATYRVKVILTLWMDGEVYAAVEVNGKQQSHCKLGCAEKKSGEQVFHPGDVFETASGYRFILVRSASDIRFYQFMAPDYELHGRSVAIAGDVTQKKLDAAFGIGYYRYVGGGLK